MIGANQDNFFISTIQTIPCPVSSVFIAWLNLDLGMKTYFTDGLNPWLLGRHDYMAAVCVSCLHLEHHCIHSWYFPIVGNSVQVLGMVLLLSYTKILCPLHHISTLLWWSSSRIVVCPYAGNTQVPFTCTHPSVQSITITACNFLPMPPIHSGAFIIWCICTKTHPRGLHNIFAKMIEAYIRC